MLTFFYLKWILFKVARCKRSIFCLILSEITVFAVTCWRDHKIQVFCIRNISKTKQTSARKHTEHSLTHLIKTKCKIWSISDKVQFWVKNLPPFFHQSLQIQLYHQKFELSCMNSKHSSQPSCMLQYLMHAPAGISCEYDILVWAKHYTN